MMNSDNGKGSEGRGLPRGWGWREGTGSLPPVVSSYLYEDGADDYNAGAYNDGAWIAYSGEVRAELVGEHDPAPGGPRSESLLAAAQREAEAALWRCDGYGVGEVRGVRVPFAFEGLDDRMTRELPGLSGRWTISKWRDAEGGGVEVDAVRAPAPIDKAARRLRPMPPVAPGAGRGEGDEEDEPDPCAKHDTTGSNIGWQSWCPGCNVAMHREPAPSREPSAPADGGELARLLPGLAVDMSRVRRTDFGSPDSVSASIDRLARACELLLVEREQFADMAERSFTIGAGEIDKRQHAERERDALRARVAELEAGRSSPEVQAIEAVFADEQTLRNWLRLNSHGDALDAGRSGVEVAIGLLSAPSPHTVAALLARVEAAAVASAASAAKIEAGEGEDAADYQSGHAHGLREAAALIRATLTPSPLDTVVAEVCAHRYATEVGPLDVREGTIEDLARGLDSAASDEEARNMMVEIAALAFGWIGAFDAAKGGA